MKAGRQRKAFFLSARRSPAGRRSQQMRGTTRPRVSAPPHHARRAAGQAPASDHPKQCVKHAPATPGRALLAD